LLLKHDDSGKHIGTSPHRD